MKTLVVLLLFISKTCLSQERGSGFEKRRDSLITLSLTCESNFDRNNCTIIKDTINLFLISESFYNKNGYLQMYQLTDHKNRSYVSIDYTCYIVKIRITVSSDSDEEYDKEAEYYYGEEEQKLTPAEIFRLAKAQPNLSDYYNYLIILQNVPRRMTGN